MLTATIILSLLTVLVATDEAANTALLSGEGCCPDFRNHLPHTLASARHLPPVPSCL